MWMAMMTIVSYVLNIEAYVHQVCEKVCEFLLILCRRTITLPPFVLLSLAIGVMPLVDFICSLCGLVGLSFSHLLGGKQSSGEPFLPLFGAGGMPVRSVSFLFIQLLAFHSAYALE